MSISGIITPNPMIGSSNQMRGVSEVFYKYDDQCSPLSLVEESRGLALIGREVHGVAPPALLCHKEPAHRIQSPLLGALERKIPPLGGILLAPRWFFMA